MRDVLECDDLSRRYGSVTALVGCTYPKVRVQLREAWRRM